MATFSELTIQDFGCIKGAKLTLNDRGLVLLVGENYDTDAADSNGVGKTTIFKALTWCLFGETIDGDRYDEIIRHGATKALVKVKTLDGWTFERARTKGKPKISVKKGKEAISGNAKELQDKIHEILGFDFQAFRNTVLYGQNDSLRFADPRTTDGARKGMLNKLLKIGIFRECEKLTREKSREISKKAEKIEAEIERIEDLIDEHDLEAIKARIDEWEGDKKRRIAGLVAKVKDYKAKAEEAKETGAAAELLEGYAERQAEISEALEEKEKVRGELEEAKETTDEEREALKDCRRHVREVEADKAKVERQLEGVSGDKCPTCGSSLKKGEGKKFVDELKAQLKELEETKIEEESRVITQEDKLEEAKKAFEELADKFDEFHDLESELMDVSAKISETRASMDRADVFLKMARDMIAEAKTVGAEKNPFRGDLKKATARLKELKGDKKKARKKLTELEDELVLFEFWIKGFGGQGIVSYMLDGIMPYLTNQANLYLDVLSDGDITMEFSTLTEIGSGELRDKIDISWIIEGHENVTPSGGQRKRMELATDLALMDVAMMYSTAKERPGLLMIDEALDGLDHEGQERVVKLLQDQRGKHGSIFVISHDATISDSFDHVVKLTKEDGFTELEVVS